MNSFVLNYLECLKNSSQLVDYVCVFVCESIIICQNFIYFFL